MSLSVIILQNIVQTALRAAQLIRIGPKIVQK